MADRTDINWTAVCQYPDYDQFHFYTPAFTVRHWSELESVARQVVASEWAKISPHPAPAIVSLLPGRLDYIPEPRHG